MSEKEPKLKILWRSSTLNYTVASFRYRFFGFYVHMSSDANIYVSTANFPIPQMKYDVGIFNKTFRENDYNLALELKKKGAKIVLDICDYVTDCDRAHDPLEECARCRTSDLIKLADLVITPTEFLGRRISESYAPKRIICIPDGVLPNIKIGWRFKLTLMCTNFIVATKSQRFVAFTLFLFIKLVFIFILKALSLALHYSKKVLSQFEDLFARSHLIILPKILSPVAQASLSTHVPSIKHKTESKTPLFCNESNSLVVWFGNSGTWNKNGVSDLLAIKSELLSAYNFHKFTLVLITDSKSAVDRVKSEINLPIKFVKWSEEITIEYLKKCSAVVLPSQINETTLGKSANRPLLALSHGAPTISSKTESTEGLQPALFVDNFESNLVSILKDPETHRKRVNLEFFELAERFNYQKLSRQYLKALAHEVSTQRSSR